MNTAAKLFVETLYGVLQQTIPSDVDDEQWWNSSLLGDIGLDSLAIVQLISEIEEQFDVELDDTQMTMDVFSTPRAFLSFVTSSSTHWSEQSAGKPSKNSGVI
ncbi:acyl carrier protein [Curtobacterium sp. TXMA1]|uniref:acyl carrier protein n=1 Tax=Curtobacterium sp. TXMA1 TaxID=2876939 RepID=UPI001CCBA199|nr:acyl carrier protein [Curtobacterium sp. TXMA1]UBQ01866.1 acyl carrier protein [Curtobacterium sp. TXMA1]